MRDLVKSSLASFGGLVISFICVEIVLPSLNFNEMMPTRFTMVLFISLLFQTLLVRYIPFLYKDDIYTYSESLAKYEVVQILDAKFGNFFTALFIYFANYFMGMTLIGISVFFGFLNFELPTLILLSLTLAFMLDPIIAFVLRSPKSISVIAIEIWPVLTGYIAVLLIGVGAIPVEVIEGGRYPYLIALCWMSARMAFIVNFAFDRKQDILVFGPSIFALFLAVGPNLILITNQL
jgi:hypothetical protein